MYVKRVRRNRIANILSIEKYLDGCVEILSLGRVFFFFFFVITRYLFLGIKSLMQREL